MRSRPGGRQPSGGKGPPTQQPEAGAPRSEATRADNEVIEDIIEESLLESFPASDPPSWTVINRIGSPRVKPTD
jgi:hypothetical protein